jgi:hypothetical protein
MRMLLRGSQAAGFTVPVVKGRTVVKADPLRDKLDRIGSEALEKRDGIDARVSAARETARSRRVLLDKLREAQERGETGKGFAKRFGGELRKVKAERLAGALNGQALEQLKGRSNDLDREFLDRALRAEAGTRARERIALIGKAIDDLVAAARANPMRFEAHHEAGRQVLADLPLPVKVVKAFRARLPEIPRAALMALAEREPANAIDLIERRKGPAHPRFGLAPAVVRLIGKQAQAKLEDDGRAQEISRGVNAARMLSDRRAAVDAVGRGEDAADGLSVVGLNKIGGSLARQLRRDIRDVRKTQRHREKAAATVRGRLAGGLKLDPENEEQADGADIVYTRDLARSGRDQEQDRERDVAFTAVAGILPRTLARTINDLVLADDASRVIAGVKLVQALESIDSALTARVDRHVLGEAHEIVDIAESGVDWHEAVRLSRESIDVPVRERERRTQQFAGRAGGGIFDTLNDVLGVKVSSVEGRAETGTTRQ